MIGKIKKILTPVSKACLVTFTLTYGILAVGSGIANNHADQVSTFLGQNITNKVYVDDADVGDTDYYKSQYSSVKEVRGAGIDYSQRVMEEGAVLLKNDNALPLAEGTKVSLFGVGSAKSTISGYRESGKSADVVSFKDGLKAANLDVNEGLYDWYANSDYGRKSIFGHSSFGNAYTIGEAPWSAIPSDLAAASGYKTAIFVISRIAGEATDVQMRDLGERAKGFDGLNGNYLTLSANERDVLENLKKGKAAGTYDKIIVIMNVTNQVECNFEDEFGVDALLYTGSIGTAGTKGIGRILTGAVNPSGKLSDTFWKNHYLNPVLANWGPASYNNGNNTYSGFQYTNSGDVAVVYQEGIYSGYRYTETRYEDVILGTDKAGSFNYNDAVAYPFGYGLSYGNFSYSDYTVTYNAETDAYDVSVKVTNQSGRAGRNAVQLFLQKPYTDYDKQNGIEKAAVELVDFAKTGVLAVGGEETVTMSVARREFACYDSYKSGTYILENGNYYLAVGNDAHDALNNILADKQKTGMVDENGKPAAGNGALSELIAINDDALFNEYSTSANGTKIENKFNDADLKLYEGAGERNKNAFEYITRKDWSGTVKYAFDENKQFLNNYVKLELTAAMEADMNAKVRKEDGEMPVMGSTETAWQLLDLMVDEEGNKIPFNDPKWDEILNQLTWSEMVDLLSNGYSTTRAIESISKPKTMDQDSDLGVILSYNADANGLASKLADPDKNKYPAAYTDNGITAGTRDKELLNEYGVQWGEDCLWAGYSGLYGTGANIHRSPYLGRSYGYYSEDPVLMGKCIAQINEGMETKGAFMLLKHCMLNEQETSRIASSSWANEQTIREVYLKPFQIAIEEGGVQGVMTSLNRIGAVAAPHHTFLNEVLRGEFGMVGYCVTDSYMPHMNIASLLVAGNDLPLDQDSTLNDYKDYPNVVNAARDCVHNILYTVVHSNAMNGISVNTRILKPQPEWQYYLDRAVPAALALMIVSATFWLGMDIWGYFGKKKDGEPSINKKSKSK